MPLGDHSLGKSLENVLAKTSRKETQGGGSAAGQPAEIPLNLIRPPGKNPRKVFDDSKLQDLADNILLHGVMQPIVLRKREAGYEIISGERRYRAAQLAGLATIPSIVREQQDSDQKIAELRLIENIQREDLNAIELAHAYRELIDDHQCTHDDLAKRLGVSRSSISNTMRLLDLHPGVQQEVVGGTLSMGHAKVLAGLERSEQVEFSRRVIDDDLSVRQLENLIRGRELSKAQKREPAPHIKELEKNLGDLFETRVKVKERAGKGSLTIHFDDKNQFKNLVDTVDRVLRESRRT